tara:strand:+ start:411 stop:1694 length:1284 start_codon:yes stop_codon:yes gene_type:complete
MSQLNEEKEFREFVRKILVERSAPLTEGPLRDAFIKPFEDVIKVAKVSLKDILTVAKFNWDMLTTFDPIKIANMRSNFKERRKKIKEEYKEVMAPIKEAMGHEDIKLAAFMLNPAGYLAGSLVKSGVTSAPDVLNFFKEAGFGDPTEGEKDDSGGKIKDPVGVIGTAFKALKKLFFIEGASILLPDGVLLTEQDKKAGTGPEGAGFDPKSATAAALQDLGVLDWVESRSKSMVEDAKSANEEFLSLFSDNVDIINRLMTANSYESLQEVIDDALAKELDIGASIEDWGDMVKEEVDKLLQDESNREAFIRAVAKKNGKEIPENEPIPEDFKNTPEEQLREEATSMMFANGTEQLREKAEEMRDVMIEKIKEEFESYKSEFFEDYGIDDQTAKVMKETPIGKEFFKHFEETEKKLDTPPPTGTAPVSS